MVADGVKSATASTSPGGQGEGQTESPKQEQTEAFGCVGGLWAVWDAGESTAREWAGLGVKESWLVANGRAPRPSINSCGGWLLPASLLGANWLWRGEGLRVDGLRCPMTGVPNRLCEEPAPRPMLLGWLGGCLWGGTVGG